jgi:putative selenate reductase FAD-binding subunit
VQHTVRHQRLVRYHRPTSVNDAVALLAGRDRIAYAGGTTIVHETAGEPVEVVDLQAVGLAGIEVGPDNPGPDTNGPDTNRTVRAGATTTLHELAESDHVPPAVRDAARAELPSTLRTLATIGGTIGAADAHSVLLAALLVHEAEVGFADGRVEPLADVLDAGVDELIVVVEFAVDGPTATAATGRTPGDAPIVAAVGRIAGDGLLLALCGVADVPVLVTPDDVASLDPPSDFRGSSEYRRELADVLSTRVIGALA